VVEDHFLNQKLMLAMLDKLGVRHQLVENGLSALEALEAKDFDLVFMDCQMPIMDGYEAIKRIRRGEAGERAKGLPILALTANAMPEDVIRCEQAGFDKHIPKPVTLETIQTTLSQWLKHT
jgi:CheY-like chemotaxis protein